MGTLYTGCRFLLEVWILGVGQWDCHYSIKRWRCGWRKGFFVPKHAHPIYLALSVLRALQFERYDRDYRGKPSSSLQSVERCRINMHVWFLDCIQGDSNSIRTIAISETIRDAKKNKLSLNPINRAVKHNKWIQSCCFVV